LIGHARETVLGVSANEEPPFEKLVEELQPGRNPSHSPLFQVMFALERAPFEPVIWPPLKLTPFGSREDETWSELKAIIQELSGVGG